MPSTNSDLDALNNALKALSGLQIAIQIVREHLHSLQRHARGYELHFDHSGEFVGASYHRESESCMLATHEFLLEVRSDCEWLPKHVDSLWESHAEVEKALSALPSRLSDKLDALSRSPWIASVRRHCVDKILAWPGETHHQTSYAAEKVCGSVPDMLEKAAKYDPFATWKEYEDLIKIYASGVYAIRDAVFPKPGAADSGETPESETADRAKLKPKQLQALEIIEKESPILGKNLAKRLGVEKSTLFTHIVPAPRAFGVKSGSDGYYVARL